ncbi:Coenzyme F420 hydrogenase/dehydrogenase, beta subunit C-terminal domain [Erythrobacter dokdonensis]|nr:Coenzyme F420 hydrogenase/dehydrogenase, beta subunit C-terminal domain [Erythrobacter dokdonensis]
MRDTPEGLRRPERVGPVSPQMAAVIDRACPGVNIRHDPAEHEAEYHSVWGPVVGARLGWSTDDDLRRNASSGGALSAILTHLLISGEIDYVVQTAVSEDSPVRNALYVSTGRDEVFHAAGSRYAPSSPLEDISKRLDSPGRFAFVGKPCDVAGLRQLARIDRRVDEKVSYMLAFMCAGVPSYRGTSAVLAAMGVKDESQVTAFRFRGDGWPGYATAQMADGTRFTMDYNTSWGSILNRHLQFRCKICPDGIGEFADIVCADGWHCDEKGYPLFEEQEGRSIVLSRTRKGEELVLRAMNARNLACEPLEIEQIRHIQPFQARRKGLVLPRLMAMTVMGRKRPRFKNLSLFENVRALGIKESVRSMLGALQRLVQAGDRQI